MNNVEVNNTIELKDNRKSSYSGLYTDSLQTFYENQGMAIECEDGKAARLVVEW